MSTQETTSRAVRVRLFGPDAEVDAVVAALRTVCTVASGPRRYTNRGGLGVRTYLKVQPPTLVEPEEC